MMGEENYGPGILKKIIGEDIVIMANWIDIKKKIVAKEIKLVNQNPNVDTEVVHAVKK